MANRLLALLVVFTLIVPAASQPVHSAPNLEKRQTVPLTHVSGPVGQMDPDDPAPIYLPVVAKQDPGVPTPEPTATPTQTPAEPPDPEEVAPPIDGSYASDFADEVAFLYSGENPLQSGVMPGAIQSRRVAVLRGQVMDRSGAPLNGVRVSILDHSEWGHTFTRGDGLFDLAVNGGGWLTVEYARTGYLPVQRKIQAPWRDYAWLPDVALTPLDSQVTTVNLGADASLQVARGSAVSDGDGSRQATLLFEQGTSAELVMPDGSTQAIENLAVRATEYTVGTDGPEAMPGDLPGSSGYTYAVEFSVDEAIAAGATEVRLNQPVYNYVENFLDFPVGQPVPTGYLDRERGEWVPSDDGLIIGILDVQNGLAVLDVDGSGEPGSVAQLDALGLTEDELAQLARLYEPGQSLWRVPIPHFTPWDHNWPYGPPDDAEPPDQPPPEPDEPEPDPCEQEGSIIECQNQVFGERIPIAGTDFSLNYRSNRVAGYERARTLDIPLSGPSIPESLRRIDLEFSVAGQTFRESFSPTPNLTHRFTWDGTDGYGRILVGGQKVSGNISYVYGAVYYGFGDNFARSFARFSDSYQIIGRAGRDAVSFSQPFEAMIGNWNSPNLGLGGWTLDMHHFYDPESRVLFLGDGRQRRASTLNNIVETIAGNGGTGFSGDGGSATDAEMWAPSEVDVGPDGSLYIVTGQRIRRVDPDGIITTIAGSGRCCIVEDGMPALEANLNPEEVLVAPDGTLYIAHIGSSGNGGRILRLDPDGLVRVVAGTGKPASEGDGGPAVEAAVLYPTGIALSPDGSLYIAEYYGQRVRRVSPDGYISTVAGGGEPTDGLGDGGPAAEARLGNTRDVAVGTDGSLYIAHEAVGPGGNRIRRVGLDGIITTVAGGGDAGPPDWGDGGPATDARLQSNHGLAIGPDGSVYFVDGLAWGVRKVRPDGVIVRVAGNGQYGSGGDGGPATAAQFAHPWGVAVDPDGIVYIAEVNSHRVRRIGPALPGISTDTIVIPSEDGRQLYLFDRSGRHQETRDVLSGATLLTFDYTEDGRLASVTDGDDNVTLVEYDSSGRATTIVSPFGQHTILSVDGNGHLASITDPAGSQHTFSYTGDGLLTSATDPAGQTAQISYDEMGKLVQDDFSGDGSWQLAREVSRDAYTVTLSSAEGQATVYSVSRLPGRHTRRTVTLPDGTINQSTAHNDGSTITQYADETVVTTVAGPDPRWGMQSPLQSSTMFATPGGLTLEMSQARTVALENPLIPTTLNAMTDTLSLDSKVWTRVYDVATRTDHVTSPSGRESSRTTDELGRTTHLRNPGQEPLTYIYDDRGRLTALRQGNGDSARTFTYSYGAQSWPLSVSDPLGQTTEFTYDATGRMTQLTLPDGGIATIAYDANGNPTAITPPGRPAHGYTYSDDLLQTYTSPAVGNEGNLTRYTYNADRQITHIERPDGATVDFTYHNGRLETLIIPQGTIRRSYAPLTGKLLTIDAPGGISTTYTWDGPLPLSSTWNGPVSGSVSRTFGPNLLLASESVNSGQTVSYSYDQDALLATAGALSLSRDATSGFVSGTEVGSLSESFSYDSYGHLSDHALQFDGSDLYTVQYERDRLGRITEKTETIAGDSSRTNYSYDAVGRLLDVRQDDTLVASYTYDTNGNRLSQTTPGGTANATYDARDRLLTLGNSAYGYNASGDLTSRTDGDGTTQYRYDPLGNLRAVTLPDGTEVEYLIDGQNRRVGIQVDGALSQGFLYRDALNPVAELDGSGNVVSRFVYAEKSHVPAYLVRDGETYSLISDQVGSVRLVVNATTGEVAQRLDYDPFGAVTLDTNPGFQPFGFAGGLTDPYSGFIRFGARDYDPATGRWTTADPIHFDGEQFNLYQYAGGDPVNYRDETGLKKIDWWDLAEKAKEWYDEYEKWKKRKEKVEKAAEDIEDVNETLQDPEKTPGEKGADILDKALEWCEELPLPFPLPIFEGGRRALEEGQERNPFDPDAGNRIDRQCQLPGAECP